MEENIELPESCGREEEGRAPLVWGVASAPLGAQLWRRCIAAAGPLAADMSRSPRKSLQAGTVESLWSHVTRLLSGPLRRRVILP